MTRYICATNCASAQCIVLQRIWHSQVAAQASRNLRVMAQRSELIRRAMSAEGELRAASGRCASALRVASCAQLVHLIGASQPDGELIVQLA